MMGFFTHQKQLASFLPGELLKNTLTLFLEHPVSSSAVVHPVSSAVLVVDVLNHSLFMLNAMSPSVPGLTAAALHSTDPWPH